MTRNTKAQSLVQTVFSSSQIPLGLGDIYSAIKSRYPKTAYSTIYRIVQKLAESGQVVRVDWRERGTKYESAKLKHHHHLICKSCGDVDDVDDKTINFKQTEVARKTGFLIEEHSIELYGQCQTCQHKQ